MLLTELDYLRGGCAGMTRGSRVKNETYVGKMGGMKVSARIRDQQEMER